MNNTACTTCTTTLPAAPETAASTDEPPSCADDPDQTIVEVKPAADVNQSVDFRWVRDHLARALSTIEASAGRSFARIGVLVVNDHRMIELHRQHSGESTTTDVLTFDLTETDDPSAPIEADIAVCIDEASRRARELGHAVERELLLYALHGVLHCVGYDDHTETGYAAMHAEEDRILRSIGVGAVFDIGEEPQT